MGRISFLSTFFCIILTFMPVIALEMDLSGRYFVEHHVNSNINLNDDDAVDSYSSMELNLKPTIIINDNIKLTTEFTVLQNHIWGTHAQPKFQQDNPLLPEIDSGNNLDWKTAYVTLKTKIGGFLIGRGIEKKWGTGLGDSTGSHGSNSKHKDGILWVVPIGNFVSGLGWQHISEGDKGFVVSDADFDKTYIFSVYKKEKWHAGLLLARYDHKNFVVLEELRNFQIGHAKFKKSFDLFRRSSAVFGLAYSASKDMEDRGYYDIIGLTDDARRDGYTSVTKWELEMPGRQVFSLTNGVIPMYDLHSLMVDADISQAFATSCGARIKDGPERSILDLWVFDPYLIGKFGNFRIEAEFLYGWGKISLSEPKFDSKSGDVIKVVDVEGIAGTIGVVRDFNRQFSLGSGIVYVQGDNSSYDEKKFSGIGYLEPSIDFEKGFLLTSDLSQIGFNFGGTDSDGINFGNLSGGPLTIAGTSGYKMFWLESKYFVSENFNFGILCVNSHADDQPKGWKSNHGVECDFTFNWRIMDNLFLDGTIAYLDAGSFWKGKNLNNKINDITALHTRLTVEF